MFSPEVTGAQAAVNDADIATWEAHPMPGGTSVVANAWMDRMLAFWSPGWTLGGCGLALLAGLAVRRRLATAARMPSWAAFLYVAGTGTALAVTLSPRSPHDSYFIFGVTDRGCDVIPWGLDVGKVLTSAEWQFNLLLLIPVGCACRFARDRASRRRLLTVAAATPIGIELTQYMVMSLNRVCGGIDVATNWLGLAVGHLVAGSVLLRLARPAGQSDTREAADA
jgi:hypothetical protein